MNAAFPETVIAANTILVHSRLIQYRLGNPAAQFDVTIMMFRGICGFLACRMVSCKDFHRAIAPRTNAYPFGLGRDTNCRSVLRPCGIALHFRVAHTRPYLFPCHVYRLQCALGLLGCGFHGRVYHIRLSPAKRCSRKRPY